jgi:hypothetical protein
LNTRTVHFTDRTDRSCTFCSIANKNIRPDETFLHLFYSCDYTAAVLNNFYNEYFRNLGLSPENKRKLWFGFIPFCVKDVEFALITVLYIQYQIWEAKLKGRLPNINKIKLNLLSFLVFIVGIKRDIISNDANLILSRNWHLFAAHGVH